MQDCSDSATWFGGIEIASRPPSSTYRSGRWAWQQYPRHYLPRWSKYTITVLVSVCAILGIIRGFTDLHDQTIKQLPTQFRHLRTGHPDLALPPRSIRHGEGYHIDTRYAFVRNLASGQEGSAVLYTDTENDDRAVVVKTFSGIARNRIPAALRSGFANYTTRWPAEIEASLLVGTDDITSGYVPVIDYFILQTSRGWFWALVTPFVPYGTMVDLAQHERTHPFTTHDGLDAKYRAALHGMLRHLGPLHAAGYCHDDIKPDNIFVHSPKQWLLGDLGNLRHESHLWHGTHSWIRQNQWADCQANDIRRAFKSYLWFLRAAGSDMETFDREFWRGEKSWSRLYWEFLDVQDPHVTAHSRTAQAAAVTMRSGELRVVTERELLCTGLPRRLWSTWKKIGSRVLPPV